MSAAKKKPADDAAEGQPAPPPRMREVYEKQVAPAMAKAFGRQNRLSLPRLDKIVVNMGVGKAIADKKYLEEAVAALTQITGQKPLVTKARKSIAGFKLREGQDIGCKVTLRGVRMYEFLDRLISLALPRVRDFRGLNPRGFDGRGNYSLGLSEQLVFPELNADKFAHVQGMNISIVVKGSHDDAESLEMLKLFGMPFRNEKGERQQAGAA